MEIFEALRDGGPRKREGGGGRWGLRGSFVLAVDGDSVAMLTAEITAQHAAWVL